MRLIDGDELIAQMEADAEHMDDPLLKMFYCAVIHDIKHAPTIEPESNWTPCGDGKPDEFERVLTTISIPNREPKVRSGTYHNGLFSNDNGDCWNATDEEVLAWMPLPEPYKPSPHCTDDYCEIDFKEESE